MVLLVRLYKSASKLDKETGEWGEQYSQWKEFEHEFVSIEGFKKFLHSTYPNIKFEDLQEFNGNDLQTNSEEWDFENGKRIDYGCNWSFLFYELKPFDTTKINREVKK